MTREKKSHRAENVLRAEDPQLGEDVLHALHHDLHPRRVPRRRSLHHRQELHGVPIGALGALSIVLEHAFAKQTLHPRRQRLEVTRLEVAVRDDLAYDGRATGVDTGARLRVPGDAATIRGDNAHRRWGGGHGRKRRCDLSPVPPFPCAFPGGGATLQARCCLRGGLFGDTLRLAGVGYARSDRHGSPVPRLLTPTRARWWGRSRRENERGGESSAITHFGCKMYMYGFIVSNGVYTHFQWANSRDKFENMATI